MRTLSISEQNDVSGGFKPMKDGNTARSRTNGFAHVPPGGPQVPAPSGGGWVPTFTSRMVKLGEAGEFAHGVLGPAFTAVDWADAFADNASSIMAYGCHDYEVYVEYHGNFRLPPDTDMIRLGSPNWHEVDWSMFSEGGTATCGEAMENMMDYASSHDGGNDEG